MYGCSSSCMYIYDISVMYIVHSVKEKNGSEEPVKYTDVAAEDTSIKEFPTDVSYATTDKAFSGDTHTKPTPQYDYARTGALKVKNICQYVHTSQTLSYVATYLCIISYICSYFNICVFQVIFFFVMAHQIVSPIAVFEM